ncbi:xanthine dehydrogenase family protein molybdopterin-binding subunit [Luminiphilus sp. nBUS_16]|uniref:xanthine dehydrogenase family protein molybdopterin-binding subunit n=1 Tax=Luminiphilus sp. nBUS_16 TaxID=3395315 RepID=UPI003EBE64D5
MNAKQEFKIVGTRPIRPDGLDKVTGRARYGSDLNMQGQIYGHILRSPHAHANIKSIDCSKALAMEGVLAVMTGDDLAEPGNTVLGSGEGAIALKDLIPMVMSQGKVLFHAQAVAAVAATTSALAAEAAAAIEVVYEVLPVVTNCRDALADDAPILHSDRFPDGKPKEPTNLAAHITMQVGEPDAAFEQADVIVERTYSVPMCHQGYIEPHACVAQVDAADRVELWCSTQGHFNVRQYTAGVTGIGLGKIRVTPSEIGGGFGGKTTVYLEPIAVLLANKSGRPVKMVMDRGDVFRATGPAPGAETRVKLGATKDGRLVAADVDCLMDSGAYNGNPAGIPAFMATACYKLTDARSSGRSVYTNKPKIHAYRAPSMPQVTLAFELVMNEVAAELKTDPLEFRLNNAVEEGDVNMMGAPYKRIGLRECLEAARSHPHYQSSVADGAGRGIAAGYWINAGMQSSATLNVSPDGSVSLLTGSPDIGGSRASMAIMGAEVLGIPIESIYPQVVATDAVGHCDVTGGSRTTLATGQAVIQAADELVAELCRRVALEWDVPKDEVMWSDGAAHHGEKSLSFKDLASRASTMGGPLTVSSSLNSTSASPGFGVHICDAEVDKETGRTTITRYTVIQDAGKAIHPTYVEGQMQGGAAQGIGWALNEEYVYNDQGVLENAGFLDYRIPVASDLPFIDTVIVEVPNPLHPYGVKGVGEVPIVPPMPAVAQAVFDSGNIRVMDLPLNPAKVAAAIIEGS